MEKIDKLRARLQDLQDCQRDVYVAYDSLEKLKLIGSKKYLVIVNYNINETVDPVKILQESETLLSVLNQEIDKAQEEIEMSNLGAGDSYGN